MEKVFRYIVIGVFTLLLLWAAIGTGCAIYWSSRYRTAQSELDNIRAELESANSRQRELEEQVDAVRTITGECIEFVDREHEILITTGNTIQEIRAGFEELTSYCESLEIYILGIRNNVCGTDNIYNTGE